MSKLLKLVHLNDIFIVKSIIYIIVFEYLSINELVFSVIIKIVLLTAKVAMLEVPAKLNLPLQKHQR